MWSGHVGVQHQAPAFCSSLRSLCIVDVQCSNNHAVVVADTGCVYYLALNEAFSSGASHIGSVVAQYTQVEAVLGLNIKRAWLLPLGQCLPYSCNCCIVLLTDVGELYICAAPPNQQRWVQQLRAELITGLESKKYPPLHF